jgi:hypothetical protein
MSQDVRFADVINARPEVAVEDFLAVRRASWPSSARTRGSVSMRRWSRYADAVSARDRSSPVSGDHLRLLPSGLQFEPSH